MEENKYKKITIEITLDDYYTIREMDSALDFTINRLLDGFTSIKSIGTIDEATMFLDEKQEGEDTECQ